MSSQTGLALGILAGGAGRRMGGIDKGWLEVQGTPAVTGVVAALQGQCTSVLISANRHQSRYACLGRVVADDSLPEIARAGAFPGPLAGIVALLHAAGDQRLLSVPVDAERLPTDLAARLLAALHPTGDVVVAIDEDGEQPLFALYREGLAWAALAAFVAGERSVQRWQASLRKTRTHFAGLRFGNRNSPAETVPAEHRR